jgi:hypothetical protein
MPNANIDSSELTRRRTNRALYAFANDVKTARVLNPYIRGAEQTQSESATVVVERQQGGCNCVGDYTVRPMPSVSNPVQ